MPKPPKYFLRFFRWFCHPDLQKPIEGDLMELYDERVKELGKKRANNRFRRDVIQLFRPSIIKPADGTYRLTNYGMIRNYFKVTWRTLLKHKLYSLINIGGLALGLTCAILIFLYVRHEFSYDQSFENSDNIYRVYTKQEGNSFLGSDFYAVTPAQLAPALREGYPEVTSAATVSHTRALLSKDEKAHFWELGLLAEKTFFDVFPFDFVEGNATAAFQTLRSMVLTESLARKIFGTEKAVGRSVGYHEKEYEIVGVIKDQPESSSLQFSFIANIEDNTWYKQAMAKERWKSNGYHTFLTLSPGSSIAVLQNKMPRLIEKNWMDPIKYPQQYFFQHLRDVHLQSNLNFDFGQKGNKQQLALFAVVAFLILILAGVNYTNLAIARFVKRAKEVGVRKVIGAGRLQLTFQFLGESVLLAFAALLLALASIPILLPMFGELVGRSLELSSLEQLYLIPMLLVAVAFLGVLSGCYPAIFMAALKPISVLKGAISGKSTSGKLQSWLIVGQYTVSIIMLICSIVIYQQFQFIQNRELGFEKEHIVTIRARGLEIAKNFDVVKKHWLGNPAVLAVSSSQNLPTSIQSSTVVNDDKGGDPSDDLQIYQLKADYDFLDVFGVQVVSGRFFSESYTELANSCVLNETAAKELGWSPDGAVGKNLTEDWTTSGRKIIGVVQDFHMHSMHEQIAPLMIELRPSASNGYISVKIHGDQTRETLAFLSESYAQYSPFPFDYQFLDDRFDQLYKDDFKQGRIFGTFTLVSIIIASLGLFGLAAFSMQQHIKEIGIRKVLGASTLSIFSKLSRDFVKMVVLGFLLAVPVALYLIDYWLENFAYHIKINGWIFLLAGVSTVFIALAAISFQTVKASSSNPVDCLQDE